MAAANTVMFNWVKTGVPAWVPFAGFFLYTGVILFFAFGLIPNFTPLDNRIFSMAAIAVIFLTDWLLNRNRCWYELQGKLVLSDRHLELVSRRGRVEHRIPFNDIRAYQIHDGVQLSLFRFLSKHRTLILELALKDGQSILVECTKWSPEQPGISLTAQLGKMAR